MSAIAGGAPGLITSSTTIGGIAWVSRPDLNIQSVADRIIVMTPRPGRIVNELRVTLPRPRDPTSADFNALKREVLASIGT